MELSKTDFHGLFILKPKVFEDSRGYFFESYNKSKIEIFKEIDFIQDNQSKSAFGTIRGLHYQLEPYAQSKLIRVLSGKILDVVIDIREKSPTFGKHFSIELSCDNKLQLFIPKGFAHGFSVLSKTATILYKTDQYYNPESERGINFNDPELNVDWKIDIEKAIISTKDKVLPTFKESEKKLQILMINILVTGANGQLGSELRNISENNTFQFEKEVNFVFTDIDTLDISDSPALNMFFKGQSFDFVINCAAYTNVDLAESDKEKAYLINATCVKNIAEAIKNQETKFIHISTDYVFDGNSHIPYTEDMDPNPQSVYGNSKLDGEKFALESGNSIVIRTSWLYSNFGKNFAKTIHKLCQERESLNVVFDQIGTPTYAYDLAIAIVQIINQSIRNNNFIRGTFHFSNEGVCSWYDFAKIIADKANSNCKIKPIESKEYPAPVTRPFYSVLNKNKIKTTFNIQIPHWQDSLNEYFKKESNN